MLFGDGLLPRPPPRSPPTTYPEATASQATTPGSRDNHRSPTTAYREATASHATTAGPLNNRAQSLSLPFICQYPVPDGLVELRVITRIDAYLVAVSLPGFSGENM